MTSSMGRSNQRLPLAWPMRTVSALTTQVRLSLADACVMMLPLSSPSCPSRRLGGLWPPGSGCRRAQNGNGRRSQKSEHVFRRGISRATTSPSADGADDGRCGQQVVGTKVGHVTRPRPLCTTEAYRTHVLGRTYIHMHMHMCMYMSMCSELYYSRSTVRS